MSNQFLTEQEKYDDVQVRVRVRVRVRVGVSTPPPPNSNNRIHSLYDEFRCLGTCLRLF
jgi:hypothetical protein